VKQTVLAVFFLATMSLLQCTRNPSSPGSSPQDPIFPRTGSILPLQKNNTWEYSYTAYDTLGRKILPNRLGLHFSIPAQYGIQNDSELVLLTSNNYHTSFQAYAYQYEMENRGAGYLVVYRDLYPLAFRGLYIIGEYDDTVIHPYGHEQLWLAFPADSGKTWSFKTDPLNDTTLEDTMEVVSANARFYAPDGSRMSGIGTFDSCYLYKQRNGSSVSYYYYNKNVGCLGYQRYVKGMMRESYILKSFSAEQVFTPAAL
jgi:hypothetical protein